MALQNVYLFAVLTCINTTQPPLQVSMGLAIRRLPKALPRAGREAHIASVTLKTKSIPIQFNLKDHLPGESAYEIGSLCSVLRG